MSRLNVIHRDIQSDAWMAWRKQCNEKRWACSKFCTKSDFRTGYKCKHKADDEVLAWFLDELGEDDEV